MYEGILEGGGLNPETAPEYGHYTYIYINTGKTADNRQTVTTNNYGNIFENFFTVITKFSEFSLGATWILVAGRRSRIVSRK